MAGYDGHRGWISYLAVSPAYQNQGLGRQLMADIEERLAAMGCPKINLLIRTDNAAVTSFYEKLGYKTDAVSSMGKRLVEDE
jgi:ribosomal protein S18 acetylase RimI-like enzyme